MGGLHHRHLFLTLLEAGKSKGVMSAGLALGESPLPGLQMATFSLCPHMVEGERVGEEKREGEKGGERERTWVSLPLLIRALIPFLRAPPS